MNRITSLVKWILARVFGLARKYREKAFWFVFGALFFLFALIGIRIALGPTTSQADLTFTFEQEDPKGLVIFVHGINANSNNTFGNWPNTMMEAAKDSTSPFHKYDVACLEYTTSKYYIDDSPSITASAKAANAALEDKKVLTKESQKGFPKYDKIVFICHSMGGLVIRTAILMNPRFEDTNIAGIFTLGSPINGAKIATFGSVIAPNNSHMVEMTERKHNGFLDLMRTEWDQRFSHINLAAYSESEPYRLTPFMIVNPDEALDLKQDYPITAVVSSLPGDHGTMVRDGGPNEAAHRVVSLQFGKWSETVDPIQLRRIERTQDRRQGSLRIASKSFPENNLMSQAVLQILKEDKDKRFQGSACDHSNSTMSYEVYRRLEKGEYDLIIDYDTTLAALGLGLKWDKWTEFSRLSPDQMNKYIESTNKTSLYRVVSKLNYSNRFELREYTGRKADGATHTLAEAYFYCLESEIDRPDGLLEFLKHHNVKVPRDRIRISKQHLDKYKDAEKAAEPGRHIVLAYETDPVRQDFERLDEAKISEANPFWVGYHMIVLAHRAVHNGYDFTLLDSRLREIDKQAILDGIRVLSGADAPLDPDPAGENQGHKSLVTSEAERLLRSSSTPQ